MPNNKFTYWNEVWESNVDVANNRSIVHCKVHLKANGSGWQTGNRYNGNVNICGINHGFSWSPGNNNFPYGSHNDVIIAEFSDWIAHDSAGNLMANISSSYNASGGYSPGYCEAYSALNCTSIPRAATINEAPDFTDEASPTIKYNNPARDVVSSLQTCISWTGGDDIKYRDINKNSNVYQYVFTEEERNLLRNACKNQKSIRVKFYVKTVLGGNTYYSILERTCTIINANPTFTDYTVIDNNTNTVNLTGSNQKYIKGYSNALITIPLANKAVAKKNAIMTKYTCNAKEVNYSNSANVTIQLNNIINNTLDVFAVDSRGNSTKVTKNINIIDYKNIIIKNIIAKRNGATQSSNLAFNGEFTNINFGKIQNVLTSVKYRYKTKDSSNWSNYIDILNKMQITSNTFKFDSNIVGDLAAEGFKMEHNYDIEVEIKDKLSTYTISTVLQSAKPLMAFKPSKGVAVGSAYDENLGGDLQVKNLVAENINFVNKLTPFSRMTCKESCSENASKWGAFRPKFNLEYGNLVDFINNEIIIKESGNYIVNFNSSINFSGTIGLWIDINNRYVNNDIHSINGYSQLSYTYIEHLQKGDKIKGIIYTDNAGNITHRTSIINIFKII